MTAYHLRPDVYLHVDYDDRNKFGSPVGERPDWSTREVFGSVIEFAQQHGYAALATAAPRLFEGVIASQTFQNITEPDGAGAWRIRPQFLYPDPALARLKTLSFVREDSGRQAQANLPLDYWPRVHNLLAALHGAGVPAEAPGHHPDMRAILELLRREDMVAPAEELPASDPALSQSDITFAGHNTAVVRSGTTSVLIDPLLFAGGQTYPAGYQPLTVRELGRIDAILLTHSHVDHFDTATLLRFPPTTRVVIPRIERETLLAIDLATRLRDLGFSNITTLDWWQSTLLGDIEVHALPFYGEQPTEGEVLHPAVRNAGNTYLLRTPTFSAAFLADSGRDGQGDVRELAARARDRFGPVDALFSGYRGWLVYPAQHLFSSVARYLMFVPPSQWSVRQQLMTTIDGALDLAERWGARLLVPYADGGAPWHWRIGLGPQLDGEAPENPVFDPFPERVIEAAARRTQTPDGELFPSPVQVRLLRPGESLRDVAGAAETVRAAGHMWPYAAAVAQGAR